MSDSTKTPARPSKPLSAGQEVDSWCTRCKMDLNHRIVAMVGQVPKRVVCLTCDSEHNFRAPKGAEASKPKKRKATITKTQAAKNAAYAEWENKIRSGKPLTPYSISATFSEGDLVSHKKFGDGYVVSTPSTQKVVIAFEDGEKTLVQGH